MIKYIKDYSCLINETSGNHSLHINSLILFVKLDIHTIFFYNRVMFLVRILLCECDFNLIKGSSYVGVELEEEVCVFRFFPANPII